MTHSDVRRLLQEKTGWDRKALSARVGRLRAMAPMSTETAQAVLAHQQNIRLDRHLQADALARVHGVLPLLNDGGEAPAGRQRRASSNGRGRPAASAPRPIVFPDLFEYTDPILPAKRVLEAREMAAVYPLLYVLENSVREFVRRIMVSRHGPDWWDTQLTSGRAKNVKTNADNRRLGEQRREWHQRRGDHPIDYTMLDELKDLIVAKRAVFAEVLGGDEAVNWVEHNLLLEIEPSRNVLCHMNPLDTHAVESVRSRLNMWRRMIERRAEQIPPDPGP